MLALDKAGCEMDLKSPRKPQVGVANHLTGEPEAGTRNILVEANRIGRGKVVDLKTMKADSLDAVILAGGLGAAKNLCASIGCGPPRQAGPRPFTNPRAARMRRNGRASRR